MGIGIVLEELCQEGHRFSEEAVKEMMAHFIWDIDESRRKRHVPSWPSKPDEFVTHCEALNRMDRGRKRAWLKSPQILASKARLRARKAAKARATRVPRGGVRIMKLERSKDWWMTRARREGAAAIGAGLLAFDPAPEQREAPVFRPASAADER